MILIIDNHDSFVYNLVHMVKQAGFDIELALNNEITCEDIEKIAPSHIILSPGPCRPNDAGICIELVKTFSQTPILGVCLGHQAIAQAFGATITHAKKPVHGHATPIWHNQMGLFSNIPSIQVARYHSLIIQQNTLPKDWHIDALSDEQEIMAIRHPYLPIFGLQFHPESIITEYGDALLKNFIQYEKGQTL